MHQAEACIPPGTPATSSGCRMAKRRSAPCWTQQIATARYVCVGFGRKTRSRLASFRDIFFVEYGSIWWYLARFGIQHWHGRACSTSMHERRHRFKLCHANKPTKLQQPPTIAVPTTSETTFILPLLTSESKPNTRKSFLCRGPIFFGCSFFGLCKRGRNSHPGVYRDTRAHV